ncbi:hypothetical protein PGT21_008045 [Puccinia graminis f. sp. tritici]|uniref:Uncharacterized protein n=1 Tax=Puccinia graminis f. sp. tritici TaxID=56615 RepID=A0A5B0PEM0_PUCGR|nr:hypothetical protein PGT21_008045 [Puccinia graminis f. sp. tritici]KAA1123256.1 hypothetical protein PGTUg99_016651 [Puccinia graminis f. sp. tritici]
MKFGFPRLPPHKSLRSASTPRNSEVRSRSVAFPPGSLKEWNRDEQARPTKLHHGPSSTQTELNIAIAYRQAEA